ncbi:LPS assembly lipoprotein LptE [Maricaulis parjimensis]|uniref:LPS assembly lipoprotein LptE n=1 Tax=Maricaulis parjimensis TaxID=144023 RepID=UPI001939AEA3|nr:LPS assembly lipoprotein LptE [Maricaulis parjimensis]
MRRTLLASLALTATLGLGACGFTPMYGQDGRAAVLSDIAVVTGEERIDFLLQQALLDAMDARHGRELYQLRAEVRQSSIPLGIGADAVVRRYTIRLRVDYAVYRTGEIDPVLTGRASGSASYDLSNSPYSALVSEQDAEERAADMAAEQITAQLLRALHNMDGS